MFVQTYTRHAHCVLAELGLRLYAYIGCRASVDSVSNVSIHFHRRARARAHTGQKIYFNSTRHECQSLMCIINYRPVYFCELVILFCFWRTECSKNAVRPSLLARGTVARSLWRRLIATCSLSCAAHLAWPVSDTRVCYTLRLHSHQPLFYF